ncbi:Conserved_hypothetical protein [Hexamita inflata]|uniref:Uncharacterized protein n=1 Tax=Hexamita inflata TaxID=28002 RepID=A0AA86TL82_9EUKA|nr:Conserved hypothetical protein [Hexamita inflata]
MQNFNNHASKEEQNQDQTNNYSVKMIEAYQKQINNNTLICSSKELTDLEFLNAFDISVLKLYECPNMIPVLCNNKITSFSLESFQFKNNNDQFQFNNLLILTLSDIQNLSSDSGLFKFSQLKELYLTQMTIDSKCLIGQHNLNKLEIDQCTITDNMNSDRFNQFLNLQVLKISYIKQLKNSSLFKSSQLKELHLTKIEIDSQCLINQLNLNVLQIEECVLTNDNNYSANINLLQLHIINCNLNSVNLCVFKKIDELYISRSYLQNQCLENTYIAPFINLKKVKIDESKLQNLTFNNTQKLQFTDLIELNISKSNLQGSNFNFQLFNCLKNVNFKDNTLDIINLSVFQNTDKLLLSWNKLTKVITVPLNKIRHLDLSFNKQIDISQIYHLTNLISLQLQQNYIKDLSPLKTLINLEELNLASNDGADITVLINLVKLQKLDLSWNKLNNILVLNSLINLQELILSQNNIIDVSPLQFLSKLRILVMLSNKVRDVSCLQKLAHFKNFRFGIQGLPSLIELKLSNKLQQAEIPNIKLINISRKRKNFKKHFDLMKQQAEQTKCNYILIYSSTSSR